MDRTNRFPDHFLWGTATASYQVEGAAGSQLSYAEVYCWEATSPAAKSGAPALDDITVAYGQNWFAGPTTYWADCLLQVTTFSADGWTDDSAQAARTLAEALLQDLS